MSYEKKENVTVIENIYSEGKYSGNVFISILC